MSATLSKTLGVLFCLGVAAGFAGICAAAETKSSLADAAETCDKTRLRQLVAEKADVNQAQADGMTALHWTVFYDDVELTKLLIEAKANVKAENRYGVMPLALACTNGNGPMVEVLLEAGADANTKLRGGETVLMTAARTGKLAPVKALLARGAEVSATELRGQTALMWAAADGHTAVVEALLAAGADFKTPLPSGFTPLLFAVREGRADVVQILLKAGADVNEAMRPRRRPAGKIPTSGTSPLIMAIENGHFEMAVELLKAGADANDQRSGFGPLHTLTWVRKPNRGEGADGDPAPRGSGKVTSLELAKALVAHGADVNLKLKRGESGKGLISKVGATPFLLAAVTADAQYMRLLVELGADPKIPNAENSTPLMAAAGVGIRFPGEEAGTEPEVLEAVALAIELGNDVNAVDSNGETAMHGAAYRNLPKVVELLAAKGAKIEVWNKKNKYRWSPITITEGYRLGNFKPSPDTLAALHQVLRDAGIDPPPPTAPEVEKGYSDK